MTYDEWKLHNGETKESQAYDRYRDSLTLQEETILKNDYLDELGGEIEDFREDEFEVWLYERWKEGGKDE